MRKFNLDELLWLVVLILMIFSLSFLLYSGKIEFYIGKKMIIYIYLSIIMLLIMTVFQICNVFTPKSELNIKSKLIPIVLALIIGAISINEKNYFRHIELNNNIINESEEGENKKDKVTKIVDSNIIIDDNNLLVLEDIRLNPDRYIGKNIEMCGFICKEAYLKNTQCVIGRIVMTCCAADSKVVGILIEDEEVLKLKENDWVYVKGTLSYTTINDDDGVSHRVPVILVETVNKVDNK